MLSLDMPRDSDNDFSSLFVCASDIWLSGSFRVGGCGCLVWFLFMFDYRLLRVCGNTATWLWHLWCSDNIALCVNPGYSFANNFDIGPLLHDGNWHPNKIWDATRVMIHLLKLINVVMLSVYWIKILLLYYLRMLRRLW